jgi:hypothetical protein
MYDGAIRLGLSRNSKIAVFGALISLLTIAFILSQIRVDQFGEALLRANYAYVLPCVLFLVLGLVTRAFRWRGLLQGALPLRRAFSIMNVAYLVNGVLPLRLGEVVRIYLTTQVTGHPVAALTAASTVIVERLLDLLAIVVMVLVALGFAPVPRELQTASLVSAVAAIGGFIVLVWMASHRAWVTRLLTTAAKVVKPLAHPRWQTWVNQFLDGLLPLTTWRGFLSPVFWTAASWILSLIAGYFLMIAVFGVGDWVATALYIAAAAFAIAVPAVPGNLGTYEGSILLALQAMGYTDFNQMAAFAVLVHAVNVLVHAVTGLIGMLQEGVSLNQLQRGVQQMRQSEG